jgi:hypothetical protein
MLPLRSFEAIAQAKKLEMDFRNANMNVMGRIPDSEPRFRNNKLDILVKVAIQPKFSVAVTFVRGLGRSSPHVMELTK